MDEEGLKKFKMEESDQENIRHVREHQAAYLEIPVLGKSAAYGEAAAFARYVRDNKIDPEAIKLIMK